MAFDRMPTCKLVISSAKDQEFTALSCGRLSPLAALGDTDGRISLHKLGEDQSSSTSLGTKRRHKGSCRSIVMDANDQYMLSAGNDKVAKITDVLVGSVIWKNVKLHE